MYSILCLFDYITLILSVPLQKATEENIFDTLDSFATSPSSAGALSELERYLSTRSDPTVSDPLAWWHDRRTMYPRLSRMALDYLTVPGAFNSLPSLFLQLFNPFVQLLPWMLSAHLVVLASFSPISGTVSALSQPAPSCV